MKCYHSACAAIGIVLLGTCFANAQFGPGGSFGPGSPPPGFGAGGGPGVPGGSGFGGGAGGPPGAFGPSGPGSFGAGGPPGAFPPGGNAPGSFGGGTFGAGGPPGGAPSGPPSSFGAPTVPGAPTMPGGPSFPSGSGIPGGGMPGGPGMPGGAPSTPFGNQDITQPPVFQMQKLCSNCNREVGDSATVGGHCPHCGVLWVTDDTDPAATAQYQSTHPGWQFSGVGNRGLIKLGVLAVALVISGVAYVVRKIAS